EVNILLQSKEQAQKRLKELEEKKSKMEELRRQIKDGERAEKVLVKEEQYKRTSVEAKRLKEVAGQTKDWMEEQTAVLEVREKELQQLEKELQEKEPVLQKQILRLKDILPKYAGIRKLEEQYNKQLKKMEHVLEECRTASADYERKYQEFFEEQAGILAKELKEGQPCPVCGSTEHPHKAELLKSAPVQEEVQQAKEKRDQKEQERSDCQEQFQASKSRLDSERKLLEQAAEDIMAGGSLQEEEAKEHLEHLEADLKEMKKNFQKKEKEFRELMEEMKRRSGLLESQEKQLQELNTKQKEEEEYFQEELKAQKFATREEYSRALEWTEGRRAKADALSEYEKECLEVKTRYEMLCQQSEGKQHADLEEEKEKLEEVLLSQKAQKDRWLHLHSQNQKNKEARSKLKQYFETKAGLTKQYEMVNNLSRTANGTLNGSIKLDFETYVQRKYFKQIIHAANRRLSKMTSNEFILQCREIKDLSSQGQAGLDLDVYHLVNDAVRDVKTLSGGESFMASLSMALGLSDIIQNTAGAISLETMFVDEGFGSLDDAARERAIQILQELAGEKGTVGIISHVNELKEQIEWKLAVTKTEQGSSTRWVLE
ncbi:SbcC/MukB-like Walker B domain-containing protein, partial [Faecalicatena contorta]